MVEELSFRPLQLSNVGSREDLVITCNTNRLMKYLQVSSEHTIEPTRKLYVYLLYFQALTFVRGSEMLLCTQHLFFVDPT